MTEIITEIASKLKSAESRVRSKKSDAQLWTSVGVLIAALHAFPEAWSGICAIDPFILGIMGYCWLDYHTANSQVLGIKEEIVDQARSLVN